MNHFSLFPRHACAAAVFGSAVLSCCLPVLAETAPHLVFAADPAKRADGRPLAAGDLSEGFAKAPIIAEKDGARFLSGPWVWEVAPTSGIVTVKLALLGFGSSYQNELLALTSDSERPYASIRNINSSGRLNGANVISGKDNRYESGRWHQVEMTVNTRSGALTVTTDGKLRSTQATGLENRMFTGVRFAGLTGVKDFRVEVAPLPEQSPAEVQVLRDKPELEARIKSLPEATAADLRKKTALLYHLEKLAKAIEQKAFEVGADIASDIRSGLARDMGRKEENHPWLQPVAQAEGNPFLDPAMNDAWYQKFAATPDERWKLSTKDVAAFNALYGKYGTFTQAVNASGWLMNYAHPQSPLKDKPELLTRALRRIDAYMDDCYFGRAHYHFFALGAALMGALIIDRTYPEMVLPNQKARWMAAVKAAGADYDKDGGGNYSNADLGCGRIRLASGLFLDNREYVERGLRQIYTWEQNIFPDGGSSYIAKQNESPGYHGPCIELAYDSYVMTRDPKILELLKMVEYYPISSTDSNRTTEWFTAPSWKQSWYGAGSWGGSRVVYYLTGNQYFKKLGNPDHLLKPTEPSMREALVYRSYPDVPKTLPNRYFVYDRNIEGVRMNYDLFSAAMNGRVTDQLVGKNTYAGLTLAEVPRGDKRAFSAAVYGINAYPAGAPTISRETVSVALGREVATLGANYTLASRLSGPSRREVPWNGRQCWLYLPDRLIGLIELTPDGKQRSKAITLNVELGRSKSGWFDSSPARKLDDRTCQYGNLLVTVLDTNLKGIKVADKADGMAVDSVRGPHSELHLVDEPNLNGWSSEQRDYEGTSYAVVELKPATAKSVATVQKIQDGGLIGLTAALEQNRFTALYNSGPGAVTVPTAPYTTAGKSSLIADRNSFAAPAPVPAEATLPPGQSLLITSGSNPQLHRPGIVGWKALLEDFELAQKTTRK